MAVRDTWYPNVQTTTPGSAFASYWGSFINIRSQMNLKLIEQNIKKKDPEYLFKRAMELEKQIGLALEEQAKIMLAREKGVHSATTALFKAVGTVETAKIHAMSDTAVANTQLYGRLSEEAMAQNQARSEARALKSNTKQMISDQIADMKRATGTGQPPPTDAIRDLVVGIAAQQENAAPGTEKFAAVAQQVWAEAQRQGYGTAAGLVQQQFFGGEAPSAYMNRVHGRMWTQDDVLEAAHAGMGGVDTSGLNVSQLLDDVYGRVRGAAGGGFGPTTAAPPAQAGAQAAPAVAAVPAPPPLPGAQPAAPAPAAGQPVAAPYPATVGTLEQQAQAYDPVSVLGSRVQRLMGERDRLMRQYEQERGAYEEQRFGLAPGLGINYMLQSPFARRDRRQGDIDRLVQAEPGRVEWALDELTQFRRPTRAADAAAAMGGAPAIEPTFTIDRPSGQTVLGWIDRQLGAAEQEFASGDPAMRAQALTRMAWVRRVGSDMAPRLGAAAQDWVDEMSQAFDAAQTGEAVQVDGSGGYQYLVDNDGRLFITASPQDQGISPERPREVDKRSQAGQAILADVEQAVAGGRARRVGGGIDYGALQFAAEAGRQALTGVRQRTADHPVEYLFAQDLEHALSTRDPQQQALALQRVTEDWQSLPPDLVGGDWGLVHRFGRAATRAMDDEDLVGLAKHMQRARSAGLDLTEKWMREQTQGPPGGTERAVMAEVEEERTGFRPPSGVPYQVDRTEAPLTPEDIRAQQQAEAVIAEPIAPSTGPGFVQRAPTPPAPVEVRGGLSDEDIAELAALTGRNEDEVRARWEQLQETGGRYIPPPEERPVPPNVQDLDFSQTR